MESKNMNTHALWARGKKKAGGKKKKSQQAKIRWVVLIINQEIIKYSKEALTKWSGNRDNIKRSPEKSFSACLSPT